MYLTTNSSSSSSNLSFSKLGEISNKNIKTNESKFCYKISCLIDKKRNNLFCTVGITWYIYGVTSQKLSLSSGSAEPLSMASIASLTNLTLEFRFSDFVGFKVSREGGRNERVYS